LQPGKLKRPNAGLETSHIPPPRRFQARLGKKGAKTDRKTKGSAIKPGVSFSGWIGAVPAQAA